MKATKNHLVFCPSCVVGHGGDCDAVDGVIRSGNHLFHLKIDSTHAFLVDIPGQILSLKFF